MTEPTTDADAARVRQLVAAALEGPEDERPAALAVLLDLLGDEKRDRAQLAHLALVGAEAAYTHAPAFADSRRNWLLKARQSFGG